MKQMDLNQEGLIQYTVTVMKMEEKEPFIIKKIVLYDSNFSANSEKMYVIANQNYEEEMKKKMRRNTLINNALPVWENPKGTIHCSIRNFNFSFDTKKKKALILKYRQLSPNSKYHFTKVVNQTPLEEAYPYLNDALDLWESMEKEQINTVSSLNTSSIKNNLSKRLIYKLNTLDKK